LKNKLVFGFNKKVIWLYIAILLCLCFSIWGVVVYAKNQNWLKMSIFIFFTVFCIFGLIIFFIKNIKFTKNYFRFGTENGWVKDKEGNTDYANKPAKARWFTTKLYYNQIKSLTENIYQTSTHAVDKMINILDKLSPLRILKSGYSYVLNSDNKPITDENTKAGDVVDIITENVKYNAKIIQKEKFNVREKH